MVTKYVLVGMLTLLAAVQVRGAEAEKGVFAEVQFEYLDEPLGGSVPQISRVPRAEYVASCLIETEEHFASSGGDYRIFSESPLNYNFLVELAMPILQTATGKTLSAEQKRLIADNAAILAQRSEKTQHSLFLGVDREQAQKTAVAFLEYLAASAEKRRVAGEEEVKKWEGSLEKYRTAYAQKSEELKAAEEEFETKQKQTHYLSGESAKEAIERMNTVIETQVIEQAVLKAKLEAVTEALAREEGIRKSTAPEAYKRQAIVLKLEEMRTEFDIEARALSARLEAAGKIRGDAEEYIELAGQEESLTSERLRLAKEVGKANGELEKAKSMRESAQPPKIVDNRITVQPLG